MADTCEEMVAGAYPLLSRSVINNARVATLVGREHSSPSCAQKVASISQLRLYATCVDGARASCNRPCIWVVSEAKRAMVELESGTGGPMAPLLGTRLPVSETEHQPSYYPPH